MVDEIACPDCAETIKAEAKVCRFCGLRLSDQAATSAPTTSVIDGNSPRQTHVWKNVAAVVAIGFVLSVLIYLQVYEGDTSKPYVDSSLIEEGQSAIARQLSDPTSAQYRNLSTAGECLTGEINAKNRLGGYVGFQDFLYDPKSKAAYLDVGLPETGLPFDLWKEQMNEHTTFIDKRTDCSRRM